jgi:hypothetical protein
MPISKNDFEHGLDEAVRNVLNFLTNNKEKAFTLGEVSKEVALDSDTTWQVIRYLAEKTYVKSKDIGANRYYMIQRTP